MALVSWVLWNIWWDWNHENGPETRPVSWSRISAAGTIPCLPDQADFSSHAIIKFRKILKNFFELVHIRQKPIYFCIPEFENPGHFAALPIIEVSKLVRFRPRMNKLHVISCILWIVPSQQKLGIISEKRTTENLRYKKGQSYLFKNLLILQGSHFLYWLHGWLNECWNWWICWTLCWHFFLLNSGSHLVHHRSIPNFPSFFIESTVKIIMIIKKSFKGNYPM